MTLHRRTLFPWLCMPLLAAAGLTALAQKNAVDTARAARYRWVTPGSDGIGKVYMDREIASVMGWQGAAWLEREEREREERGDLLLRELALQSGMTVADIGAGTGYYARRLSPLLGPSGTVYAVDVQPEMIRMLNSLAGKAGITNIRPVLASADNVKLPGESIDLAIMVDVYHELAYPSEVMDSLVRSMKSGGRIVFVEYRAEDPAVDIKPLHKMSEVQVRREANAHGLTWERTITALPIQHVIVFRKP